MMTNFINSEFVTVALMFISFWLGWILKDAFKRYIEEVVKKSLVSEENAFSTDKQIQKEL